MELEYQLTLEEYRECLGADRGRIPRGRSFIIAFAFVALLGSVTWLFLVPSSSVPRASTPSQQQLNEAVASLIYFIPWGLLGVVAFASLRFRPPHLRRRFDDLSTAK